jgi:hypothetical protein
MTLTNRWIPFNFLLTVLSLRGKTSIVIGGGRVKPSRHSISPCVDVSILDGGSGLLFWSGVDRNGDGSVGSSRRGVCCCSCRDDGPGAQSGYHDGSSSDGDMSTSFASHCRAYAGKPGEGHEEIRTLHLPRAAW